MNPISILIADNSFLSRKGLEMLLNENPDFKLVGEALINEDLFEKTLLLQPDVLIIDHSSSTFHKDVISLYAKKYPHVKILAITGHESKSNIVKSLKEGVTSYLLKECDKEEITEAIYKTATGEKFICGQILQIITEDNTTAKVGASCQGLNISEREIEIISLIAEGFSNKEIAEKLFLSAHTVTTHRKNIMNKLDINNTAGLVLFAVRENLISPNKYLFSSEN